MGQGIPKCISLEGGYWEKESLERGGWKAKKKENEIKVKQAHVINLRFSDYWILNLGLAALVYHVSSSSSLETNKQ